ncbi:MAG: ABC transporter permease subunit [Anaerolineaceae bacterium]|nr:ABC transporter permease subunit [Anaerolineaceae bacterium]
MSILAKAEQRFAYIAILPAILMIGGLLMYPIGYAIFIAFHRTNNGLNFRWVGLENFTRLLNDPTLWRVFGNNFLFLVSVPLVLLSSLVCAALIYEEAWGWRFFRVVFFIPSVISTVVIGTLFRQFFDYDGPVNQILASFGVAPIDWLARGSSSGFVIILVLVWSGFGYGTLILLSAMTSIDPTMFESARLDGANWWHRIRYITIPLIAKVLAFLTIINVIYTFLSLFGLIFVLTNGGPGYETTTLDYFVFLKAFSGFDFGQGAALALMLAVITLSLTAIQLWVARFGQED